MRNDVLSALERTLSRASLLRPEATLLAAISGGADSVALLEGLALLRENRGFALQAVHVEHGLRGEASHEDAAFVEDLCQKRGIRLFLYHAALPGTMDSPGVEALAREARRRFFAHAMEEGGAQALLTAHHQDDQAETVLMRLLRGAGARGLAGMRESTPFAGGLLLRPFLSLPDHALRQFLGERELPWREDESNQEPCCLRNRLRLETLPLLETIQPQARAHMAQTAQRLAWDEDCLSALGKELLDSAWFSWPYCHCLERQRILDAPMALALRALRAWVRKGVGQVGGLDPSGEHALSHEDTLELYELASSPQSGSRNLPSGLKAIRTEGYLHLEQQDGRPLVLPEALQPLPIQPCPSPLALGPLSFTLSRLPPGQPLPDGTHSLLLSDTLLALGLVLRTPKPGDRIHPFGAPGGKALRRYLTDQKVDAAFRPGWPVLAREQEILWVPGIGAAEGTRMEHFPNEQLWKLTVKGAFPIQPKRAK